MSVKLVAATPWKVKTDALLVPVATIGGSVRPVDAPADPAAVRLIGDTIRQRGLKDPQDAPVCVPTWGRLAARHLILVPVALSPGLSAWRFERAVAAAARMCRGLRLGSLTVGIPAAGGLDPADAARRIARGAGTGSDRFEVFKKPDPVSVPPALTIAGAGRAATIRRAAQTGVLEAGILNEISQLANLPGREATPEAVARACRRLGRKHGFSCRVHDRRALERLGCRALLAVGQGSRNEPRAMVLEYRGAGRAKPVALVGKTVTFDSGGLSLKPPKGMETMRYDKSGGMAVLAAISIAAARRLPVNVTAILAAAENMPGGAATRPGDVVRARSGTTIEILNTDAEGRLVLADALSLAADAKPAAIVDLATLTGAVVTALGHHVSAVLGTDDRLVARLREAGESAGDRLWPLPLWPEYESQLRSEFADVRNIGDGNAGTIIGAAFLKRFAPDGVPWAHVDIAGTAWEEKPVSHRGAGATLAGARMLVEWLDRGAPAS
jgi:leucyl aminopeptidase